MDLIFAHNDNTAKAAQRATSRIPIVVAEGDPLGQDSSRVLPGLGATSRG